MLENFQPSVNRPHLQETCPWGMGSCFLCLMHPVGMIAGVIGGNQTWWGLHECVQRIHACWTTPPRSLTPWDWGQTCAPPPSPVFPPPPRVCTHSHPACVCRCWGQPETEGACFPWDRLSSHPFTLPPLKSFSLPSSRRVSLLTYLLLPLGKSYPRLWERSWGPHRALLCGLFAFVKELFLWLSVFHSNNISTQS